MKLFLPFVYLLLLAQVLHPQAALAADCADLPVNDARTRMPALADQIRHHNHVYFDDNRSEVADEEYDRLFAELLRLETCFAATGASGLADAESWRRWSCRQADGAA